MKWNRVPVRPQPVCTSSKTSTMSVAVHSCRRPRRKSAEQLRSVVALNGSTKIA